MMKMKRMLALTLCLVMVLGLFTGVAGANGPEPLVIYQQTGPASFDYYDAVNIGPFSSFGFNAHTGTTTAPVRIENATFSLVDADGNPTSKLGELHEDYDQTWDIVFDTENAWPNTTGYLRATVGETIYQMPVSIGSTQAMVYTTEACTEYLPPSSRMINYSTACYIAIQSALIGAANASVSDPRFTLGEPVEKTIGPSSYYLYRLSVPENFSGTSSVSVACEGLQDWAIPTITFTDGKILTTRWDNGNPTDDGNVPACGDWGVRMFYGMENDPVPSNAEVYFLDSTDGEGSEATRSNRFGTISYNPNDGRWGWIRDSAIAGATGTMVAKIGGVEYTRSVTMTYPELTFFTYVDLSTSTPEYVPYDSLTFLYDGTTPICYVAATMDWIKTVELSDDTNFRLDPIAEGANIYTITAKEGVTGTHVVEFVATDSGNSRFECEATFTDGKNLTILWDDGQIIDGSQITPIGNGGIDLKYGLNGTPVPSDATIVFKDSNGNQTNSLGTIVLDPGSNNYGSWTWRWNRNSVIPGSSGSMEVTIDNVTYSCKLNFIMPALALFSQEDCSLASYVPFSDLWEQTYSSSNMPNLYIQTSYDWRINSYETDNPNIIVEEVPGKHVLRLKQGATGEQAGDIEFHLTNGNGDNNYYGVGFRFINRGSLAKEKDDVTQWTNRTSADNHHEIASVTYQGNTYYLVLTNGTDGTIIMKPMYSTGLGLDDTVICDYYVDFCTKSEELNRYQRVDADLSAALFDRFVNGSKTGASALVFEILPINYTFLDSTEYTKPTHTPNIYYGPENWPISYQAVYDKDCGGEFLIRVSGNYTNDDGSTKFCETYATEGIFPIVHDEISFNSVADAQTYLNNYHQNTASDMLAIRFNVKELSGHLVIPDELHNIALHGGYYDENGEWQKTIWRGGVSSGADFGTQLQFFHFIGAGGEDADIEEIPQYWPGTNIPNYAIYGPANGVPHHCIIEGYYHGIHMDQTSTATHFGGEATTYYRNITAVYIDIQPNSGGWLGNADCTFEENGTALDFVAYPTKDFFPMGDTEILRARFINNDVDVRNTTGQILWMPMNYFVHDKQFENGDDIENAEKKRTPILEGSVVSKKKEVETTIPYPMAWDTNFNEDQYYYPKKYTTKNDLARMYPYVSFKDRSKEMQQVMLLSNDALADTMTVDSLSGEDWVASMEVTTPAEPAPTPTVEETLTPTVYTRDVSAANIMRFSRVAMASRTVTPVYTMFRNENEDHTAVTLDLPFVAAGSTGTGQTWVDENWLAVKVTVNGKEVKSSVNNSIVTFDLASGYSNSEGRAVYEITPIISLGADNSGNPIMNVAAPAGAAHVMLAAYNTDQQMLWATPGSIDENGNVVLPCEDFTNVRSITFFFLDGNYAPIEGSITRTIS